MCSTATCWDPFERTFCCSLGFRSCRYRLSVVSCTCDGWGGENGRSLFVWSCCFLWMMGYNHFENSNVRVGGPKPPLGLLFSSPRSVFWQQSLNARYYFTLRRFFHSFKDLTQTCSCVVVEKFNPDFQPCRNLSVISRGNWSILVSTVSPGSSDHTEAC